MIKIFEVGGCVRDHLLGLNSKDIDFAVEVSKSRDVNDAFDLMRQFLVEKKFQIFLETPEYGTIRARFPRPMGRRPITGPDNRPDTADFVLCRKDGPSSDNRRPDYVTVGTLQDDLARRDFTINAMARELDPETLLVDPKIIDPFGGQFDLGAGLIRFVGDPEDRLQEDGLRALRAIRFMITKGFTLHSETRRAICDESTWGLVRGVSVERRREELEKCFAHDTLRTMEFLQHELPPEMVEAMFVGGLRLAATLRQSIIRT